MARATYWDPDALISGPEHLPPPYPWESGLQPGRKAWWDAGTMQSPLWKAPCFPQGVPAVDPVTAIAGKVKGLLMGRRPPDALHAHLLWALGWPWLQLCFPKCVSAEL